MLLKHMLYFSQEMNLLAEVDQPGSPIDNYVTQLSFCCHARLQVWSASKHAWHGSASKSKRSLAARNLPDSMISNGSGLLPGNLIAWSSVVVSVVFYLCAPVNANPKQGSDRRHMGVA